MIIWFFTGMDLLVVLALILIPVYGLSLNLLDAVAWIADRAYIALAVIVALFVIAGIITYIVTREGRTAIQIATVAPLSVVNPVMTFVGLISAGFSAGGFFMKIFTLFVAIVITMLVALASLILGLVSISGVWGIFDQDHDDERSLPTFVIEHIIILGLHLAYAIWTMT